MEVQWSSSGSFLLCKSRHSALTLYSIDTSERHSIPELIYEHNFAADEIDREFVEFEIQRNIPGFLPVYSTNCKHPYNLLSASIGVRPETGEPVIVLLRNFITTVRKTESNSLFDLSTHPVHSPFEHQMNDSPETRVLLNQMLIINARTSCLDVEHTNVANSLIVGSNFASTSTEWFSALWGSVCREQHRLVSPDCRRILFLRIPSLQMLLLDLSKQTVTPLRQLEIALPTYISWSEDSRLVGLSTGRDKREYNYETRLYDCESQSENMNVELTVEPLRGKLLALRWLSQFKYMALLSGHSDIKVPIESYEVSIKSGCQTYPQLLFKVDLQFTTARRYFDSTSITSICFDRFCDRYFLILKGSFSKYVVSFQQPELSSTQVSPQKNDSIDCVVNPLPNVHVNIDPNLNQFSRTKWIMVAYQAKLWSQVTWGSANPVRPIIACSAYRLASRIRCHSNDFKNPHFQSLEPIAFATADSMAADRFYSYSPTDSLAVGGRGVETLTQLAWRTLYSSGGARALESAIRQKRVPPSLLETSLMWNPYTLGPHPEEWLQ